MDDMGDGMSGVVKLSNRASRAVSKNFGSLDGLAEYLRGYGARTDQAPRLLEIIPGVGSITGIEIFAALVASKRIPWIDGSTFGLYKTRRDAANKFLREFGWQGPLVPTAESLRDEAKLARLRARLSSLEAQAAAVRNEIAEIAP